MESGIDKGKELITEFLESIKTELIEDMDRNNRNATGKTRASLKLANVTGFSGQLLGAEHIQFSFQGRGPGKMPPLSQIIDWCNARGIPRKAAWIIAKRISEAGTKLFRQGAMKDNALKRALSEKRIKEFTEKVKQEFIVKIQSDLRDLINQ